MSDGDYSNIYAIPANYTDSGKLLGGMIDTRNAIETVILMLALGYPELILIPMPGTIRIVVMTVTLLPLAVVSAMGVDGGSLFQYIGHIIYFWTHRRKLHFRRIGYHYGQNSRKKKAQKRKTGVRAGVRSLILAPVRGCRQRVEKSKSHASPSQMIKSKG